MSRRTLSVGDPVEVIKFWIDGKEINIPATVVSNEGHKISVAYADGTRESLGPHQQIRDMRK